MIHEDPDAITGLGFKQTALQFIVFAATRHHVLSFTLGVKSGDKIHKEILDEHGCKVKCAAITDSLLENQFVVGRLGYRFKEMCELIVNEFFILALVCNGFNQCR